MIIGKNSETKENVNIDLIRLISTRLLIQANSGGGKSWLIRRLLEQTHGKVQQIVIDLEGEFSTLREQYDYLLVGKDGEIPANIQTAELLAIKLLKLNVSTIIDLSELKHHERILFVQRFLDSLVNAPRELWHTCLVIVDEAHQFCPEGKKSESASSVIDLQTRGRKRGFCGVLATQRISKLHKDAAAECNNVLVGRTVQDIDRKRASSDLGFVSKEQEISLRNLGDGEFYAYGPAISKEDIIKVKVGDVKTTHPEPGKSILKASQTPDNIKKLLKDVIDLPKEAEEEIKTKKDFLNKINELKRELRISKTGQLKTLVKVDEKAIERAFAQGSKETQREMIKEIEFLRKENNNLVGLMNKIGSLLKVKIAPRPEYSFEPKTLIKKEPVKVDYTKESIPEVPEKYPISNQLDTHSEIQNDIDKPLKAGAMKMLGWLAGSHPDSLNKERIAALSGFSVNGGTFGSYLSALRKRGWITGNGDLLITEEGLENASPQEIPSGEQLIQLWATKFKAGVGKMLRIICDRYPDSISKEELGSESGFEPSGGTFGSYLSKLKKNNLIKFEAGEIIASSEFFE